MRANYSPRLRDRTERTDPTSEVLVDALIAGRNDIKQRKDQWEVATGASNFDIADDGRVTIQGTFTNVMSQLTTNNDETRITRVEPFYVGEVLWSPALDANFEITDIDVQLDAQPASNVATWQLEIWVVLSGTGSALSPYQLAKPYTATAAATAGGGPQVVTFNFGQTVRPRPKIHIPTDGQPPKSFVSIIAFDSTGGAATLVAQRVDTAQNTFTDSGTVLEGRTLQSAAAGQSGFVSLSAGSVPYLRIRRGNFSAQDLTFGAANLYDLGGVPTDDVEVVLTKGEPPGTSIVMEVDQNILTPFTGSEVAVTAGGFLNADFGIALQQRYAIRYRFTPSISTATTPTLWTGGLQETQRVELFDEADVQELVWSVPDPFTHKARVPEMQLVLSHLGQPDKEDVISRLLSEQTIGKLRFRVSWGDRHLPRAEWMDYGTFEVDGYQSTPGAKLVTCISPLQYLRGVLPVPSQVGSRWDTTPFVVASGTALENAYQSVLAEAAIPAQYQGGRIGTTGLTVGNTVEDSDIKAEADALALIADHWVVDKQGRITAIPLENSPPVHTFRKPNIQMLSADPGYADREAVVFVKWGYNVSRERFNGLSRSASALGVTELGEARINRKTFLPDTVSRWLEQTGLDPNNNPESTTANQLGARLVQRFGLGKMMWRWASTIAQPQIELGDRVIVETTDFVAPDPSANRALRGNLWAIARIMENRIGGREFVGVVESYADIFAGVAPGLVIPAEQIIGIPAQNYETDLTQPGISVLVDGARATTDANATRDISILTLPAGLTVDDLTEIRVWYDVVFSSGTPSFNVAIQGVQNDGTLTGGFGDVWNVTATTGAFVERVITPSGPINTPLSTMQLRVLMTPGVAANTLSFSNIFLHFRG